MDETMTLHLDLSPQAEKGLREFARTQGCPLSAVVGALVEEMFAPLVSRADISVEEDAILACDDFAVLVDLLGPEFARCVASGVLPLPSCPETAVAAFPK